MKFMHFNGAFGSSTCCKVPCSSAILFNETVSLKPIVIANSNRRESRRLERLNFNLICLSFFAYLYKVCTNFFGFPIFHRTIFTEDSSASNYKICSTNPINLLYFSSKQFNDGEISDVVPVCKCSDYRERFRKNFPFALCFLSHLSMCFVLHEELFSHWSSVRWRTSSLVNGFWWKVSVCIFSNHSFGISIFFDRFARF